MIHNPFYPSTGQIIITTTNKCPFHALNTHKKRKYGMAKGIGTIVPIYAAIKKKEVKGSIGGY